MSSRGGGRYVISGIIYKKQKYISPITHGATSHSLETYPEFPVQRTLVRPVILYGVREDSARTKMILIREIQVKCEDNETGRDRARAWKRDRGWERARGSRKGDRDKWKGKRAESTKTRNIWVAWQYDACNASRDLTPAEERFPLHGGGMRRLGEDNRMHYSITSWLIYDVISNFVSRMKCCAQKDVKITYFVNEIGGEL